VEAAAGINAHARFPTIDRASHSEDAVDSTLAATVWDGLDSRTALGIGYEYIGLGTESFAFDAAGNSLDASYNLHVLWLRGRLYLRPEWPSFYLGLGLGASLQSVRATGTESAEAFTVPGRPFECHAIGGFGGAASASVGGEVKLPSNFAFLTELEGTGHLMRGAADEFSGCRAPGAGPALQAALRVGFAYYFPL
jgi:hypothetical protein